MSELAIALCLVGGACGFVGMVISLICVACVVGFLRSTHKIQYVPLKDEGESAIDEVATTIDEELLKVGKKRSEVLKSEEKIISEAEESVSEVIQSDFLN